MPVLRSLYRAVMALGRPLLLRKLRRRGEQEPLYLHAVHQRFADYTPQEQQQAAAHVGAWVWIHAVSLGETRAAAILLQALRSVRPDLKLLLTNGTATGHAEGRKLLRDGDMQVWLPLDSRAAARRFLQLFRPRVGLLLETEMWPELLQQAQELDIPMVLANARMSEKTLQQSLRLSSLAYPGYRSLRTAYVQTASDAERLRQLQVQEIRIVGNLKFDASPAPELLAQGRQWRQQLQGAAARPLAMLASSREGEERMWLQAWESLSQQPREAVQWLLVPRHPQRFDEVAALLQQQGVPVLRRSAWDEQTRTPAGPVVWLGDSLGEMPMYYAMADLALMGGSFEQLGGQNLIEACACGCPVLLGPHTFNFAEASEQAIAAGAALRCVDMSQAVREAGRLLLEDAPAHQQMQQACGHFTDRHRGAAMRMAQDLQARGLI